MRDLTTLLDMLGALLVAAAVSLWCWAHWGAPAGLLVAGVGLLGISLLVDTVWAPRRQRKAVRR